jgi:tetratricopeptide (TPR) repeat protein
MKRCLIPAGLLLLSGLVAYPSRAWAQGRSQPSAPRAPTFIHGQVRYAQGRAAGLGILITLEDAKGGFVAQVGTDSQGKFAFNQVPRLVYLVKMHLPGYQDASERVDLTTGPTANVVFTLQPLPGETPPSVPPSGESSISAQKLSVPSGARKEFEKGQSLLLERKKAESSIPHFLKAIELHGSYAHAYLLLGTAHADLNQWKEAQAGFEKAIELDSKLAAAHLALGACLAKQGNFAAAEKPLLRGLELSPQAAQGHYELGRTYWALGRWQEAEPHAREAVKLAPSLAPAYVLMGNILLRRRDAPGALKYFKDYLRLDPDGPLATPTRQMVAKIENMLATPK